MYESIIIIVVVVNFTIIIIIHVYICSSTGLYMYWQIVLRTKNLQSLKKKLRMIFEASLN